MQTTDTVTTETSKAVWATPAIETYDVAEFTLGQGNAVGDLNASLS